MTIRNGFVGTVGNTPLIKLRRASEETGCTILGKAEFLNPGGSVKDRAALYIIKDAEERGLLRPGGVIVEGTAGNTGIGLALVGNARGYRTVIVMPETQSQEKKDMLRLCGVDLRLVPAVPYANPMNYVRYSGRLAEEIAAEEPNGAIWANQFDNLANRRGHYETTGPEIWEETDGKVDGFTCSVGTGGTLSGVGIALKERNPRDPDLSVRLHGLGHLQLVRPPRVQARRQLDHRRHRQQPRNQEPRRLCAGRTVPDHRRRDAAGPVRPCYRRRAGPRRLDRDQCLRGDPPGPRTWARTHDRYDPRRFRHPLSVEAVQPGIPEGARPADPALAGQREMTELLFREDGYLRSCIARVTQADERGIRLDRTVFYPTGGGQPGDTGLLRLPSGQSIAIIDTLKGTGSDEVIHVPEPGSPLPEPGAELVAEIDWERRHRLMRMHTSLHLLCSVVPGAVTGGQVSDGRGRLDFDVPGSSLDKEAIASRLNALIAEGHSVGSRWITDEDLAAQPELVRTMSVKPPSGTGRVRLMEIAGVDLQPCGGTHVRNTAEIGPVVVTKIENKGKQNRRVILAFAE